MPKSRVYASYSSDGAEKFELCDGKKHFHLTAPLFDDGHPALYEHGDCDGSCQVRDLRPELMQLIERIRTEELEVEDGVRLKGHIEISPEAQAILDGAEVTGVRIDRWYAKRGGEGSVYCLASGMHLRADVSYDWWSGQDMTRYQTLTMEVRACGTDGIHRGLTDPHVATLLSCARK